MTVVFWALLVLVTPPGSVQAEEGNEPIRIGLITNNPNGLRNIEGFREGLGELGYVEGDTVEFEFSGQPTPEAELEETIGRMIENGIELLFTTGTPTGIAAYSATLDQELPVIFGVIADPIAAAVVDDLSRPGGNLTGVMLNDIETRRLELLLSLAPAVRRVWILYNDADPAPATSVARLKKAAAAFPVDFVYTEARSSEAVKRALAAPPPNIDAIFMVPDTTVNFHVRELLGLALQRRIPVSGPSSAQVHQGALMSYGFDHREVGLQAAHIADRVLRGADPASVPVENADFYLTVNLAAAERIGLHVPDETLQQADYIIRSDALD